MPAGGGTFGDRKPALDRASQYASEGTLLVPTASPNDGSLEGSAANAREWPLVLPPPPPLAPAYRRSSFQVALLLTATFGLYIFVWAYWTRRWCASALEREDQPLWKTIALVIPIFNFFLVYDLGSMIEGTVSRANLPAPRTSLAVVGLTPFIFGILSRLSDPWSHLSFLSFVPIALLQWWLVRAEVVLAGPEARPTRFHPFEWVVLGLGAITWALGFIDLVTSVTATALAVNLTALAAVVAALIAFARAGDRSLQTISQTP
jgi:hypothetical protein